MFFREKISNKKFQRKIFFREQNNFFQETKENVFRDKTFFPGKKRERFK